MHRKKYGNLVGHGTRRRRSSWLPWAIASLAMVCCTASAATVDERRGDCGEDFCPRDAVFQTAPLQALMAGVLESPVTFATGLRHGDFGLGGMSPLDGEVIVVDGMPYHAREDGSIRRVDPGERTSVLIVKHFQPDTSARLAAIRDLDDLVDQLDAAAGFHNRIHAVRIDGRFDTIRLRSVPRQSAPYVPVTTVVQSQKVFEMEQVDGTLVGFRFPAWARGINAPGYHFHFVDEARERGGHVLDVAGRSMDAQIDTSRAVTVMTPDDPLFDNMDFDSSGESIQYRRALRPDAKEGRP